MVLGAGSLGALVVVAGALALGLSAEGPQQGAGADVVVMAAAAEHALVYALPLAGEPTIVRELEPPATTWSAGHRGVDLAAGIGAAVVAPADGTVTFAGTVVDRGVVTLTHPDGLRSSLEPLAWSVPAGAHVARGQPIGTVQAVAGHCMPASCVHWGVRRGETYLDPLSLLPGAGLIVLLPEP